MTWTSCRRVEKRQWRRRWVEGSEIDASVMWLLQSVLRGSVFDSGLMPPLLCSKLHRRHAFLRVPKRISYACSVMVFRRVLSATSVAWWARKDLQVGRGRAATAGESQVRRRKKESPLRSRMRRRWGASAMVSGRSSFQDLLGADHTRRTMVLSTQLRASLVATRNRRYDDKVNMLQRW